MYIEAVPDRNSPSAILLRETYRQNSRFCKRTLCNLSHWPTATVEGLRGVLKGGTVIPAAALIAKFHRAKVETLPAVELWGSGRPMREFLYADDLADALVFLMKTYSGDQHVNVGTGQEISILELAHLLKKVVGYEGELTFDSSKPDGMMRKVMNVERLAKMGWRAETPVEEGFAKAYRWYVENIDEVRR